VSTVDLSSVSLVALIYLTAVSECFPYSRWYDYDFPAARPIHDSGSGHVLETVNPLRPYEPWILNCILSSRDKVEEGKRHPRCQTVDETNEKEYEKFLFNVGQWEEAYPDRAAKWNLRFPEGKAEEMLKYERLKAFADMHNLNLVTTEASANYCPDCEKSSDNLERELELPDAGDDGDDDQVEEQASNRRTKKVKYT